MFMDIQFLINQYQSIFEKQPQGLFFAPGRINLIGEHTDYNGGYVLPCAISIGTYGLASIRNDSTVNVYSENFPDLGVISFDINNLDYQQSDSWANYPKGMIRYLKEAGHNINYGMDVLCFGNIPNASGLSSSASLQLLFGVILENLFNLDLEELELILTSVRVENNFMGVKTGIMDQFAIGKGQKDRAILLNCNSLEYEMIPIHLKDYSIIIMNTKKRRELIDSKYNERRNECEKALSYLQTKLNIDSLSALDNETFESNIELIPDPTLQKRARHVVSENQRTLQAAEALKNNDLHTLGKFLNESHVSLRDDYEVTGKELDTLVDSSWKQAGVLGARMTGAGFGGCGIAIVRNDALEQFQESVGNDYLATIGYPAEFYIANIHSGAAKIPTELLTE